MSVLCGDIPSLPLEPPGWWSRFKEYHTKPWVLFKQETPEHGPYVLMVWPKAPEAYREWISTLYPMGWHVLNLDTKILPSEQIWLFSCEWTGNAVLDHQKALRLLQYLDGQADLCL